MRFASASKPPTRSCSADKTRSQRGRRERSQQSWGVKPPHSATDPPSPQTMRCTPCHRMVAFAAAVVCAAHAVEAQDSNVSASDPYGLLTAYAAHQALLKTSSSPGPNWRFLGPTNL